jgi:hypothetical protein
MNGSGLRGHDVFLIEIGEMGDVTRICLVLCTSSLQLDRVVSDGEGCGGYVKSRYRSHSGKSVSEREACGRKIRPKIDRSCLCAEPSAPLIVSAFVACGGDKQTYWSLDRRRLCQAYIRAPHSVSCRPHPPSKREEWVNKRNKSPARGIKPFTWLFDNYYFE